MKVGSRPTSRCAKLDASKRCGTIAEAVEASRSPAAGFRAFLLKYQALVAILRTREGSQEAMDNIAPLTAAAELVKIIIRGRSGLVVTQAMNEALRDIIVWHAKRCGTNLRAVGGNCKPTKDQTKNPEKHEMAIKMLTKERRLIAKMQAGITIPRSSFSSTVDSSSSTGCASTAPSGGSESVLSSRYAMLCSLSKATRGVVKIPPETKASSGAAGVAAKRTLVVPNPWLDARLLWG
eukprot:jgi/Undpi1/9274/HiC_scaffold_26.g11732.m1